MPQSLAHFQPQQHHYGLKVLAPVVVQHFKNSLIQARRMQEVQPDMDRQVAELRGELRKVREERDRAHRVLEVTEWKALASANDRTTIETLEAERDASRESESRMLESLSLQTKQLEITMMELEEARLEIASLRDTVQSIEASACAAAAAKPRGRYDRDLQRVSSELRVALATEEKSKRAMEELVLALKEVKAELYATRQQLARAQREAETARLESDRLHVSVKRKDDKVRALSDEVARLRADAEESAANWRAKEAGFTACMKSTEAELAESRRENSRLLESQRSGRNEVAKLRDILKQAVKDSKLVKEELEEAKTENAKLKETVGNKDNAVKCTKQELDCLRVSEAAARDSVKELQSLLVATSSSPTASVAASTGRSLDLEEEPSSPQLGMDHQLPLPAGCENRLSTDAKVKPPDGMVLPRQMSENFEGSVYDIFGTVDEQKGEQLGVFTRMPSLPGRRRVVMRRVGSLFRWKSFNNK
ncbi:nuclear matrix constituent protein 1a-like [Lolium rigidum]|uniref:nuclear matrix constituent protein 1a-like n=1 Tax=Lolium rigidum TaxID=89674 RepID=UPI001F5C96E4|nr:nuclear matrix constituent protein 1a-like [Lolium rigidum]